MSTTITEVWKPVKGYEGLYEVSNLGRVKSLGKFNKNGSGYEEFIERELIRKQRKTKLGYMNVVLQKDKKPKTFRVHRLVADAFIPNPYGKEQVNHKDYDRANNRVENLEWMSAKENYNYSIRHQPKVRRTRSDSSTGERYISFKKSKGRYEVTFKQKRYGTFKTLDEAKARRDQLVKEYEKAHPSK